MGKNDKSDIEKYNVALQTLGHEISMAVDKYLKNGHVNFAAAVGVLEDIKITLNGIIRKRELTPKDKITFKKLEPTSYIG